MVFSEDNSSCVVDIDVDCSIIESATLFIEDCLAIVLIVCNEGRNAVVDDKVMNRLAIKYLINRVY